MPFSLPNPTVPTNGQALDATPLLANIVALAHAIQSFDGSQIQTGTIIDSALATTANPNTLLAATTFPFVASGCVWSTVSGLSGGMTGGTIYYNGTPVTVNSVASHTFTASMDTYIDVDKNGNITYQAVSNNSTSPSLTANSIRIAIVITGSSAISFVNIGQPDTTLSGFAPINSSVPYCVQDSLGNLIYPTDPSMKILGYRQINSTLSGISTSNTQTQITGLSCPVIVPAGRKVEIIIHIPEVTTDSITTPIIGIYDGTVPSGTFIQGTDIITLASNIYVAHGHSQSPLLFPSTGLHTYNAAIRNTAFASVGVTASANVVPFIRVELA